MDIRHHGRGIQHIVDLGGLWPRGIFLGALFGHLDKTMVKDFYHNHLAPVKEWGVLVQLDSLVMTHACQSILFLPPCVC